MYGPESPVVIQAAERSSLSDLRRAPSIPVMELHDPSCGLHLQSQENLAWSSRMYQPYKGQLKLAVYVNCGLLTVHVKEARQLSSSYGAECNTFVKLSLSPDETKRTKCRTSVVAETDRPEFDEKFSFELLDGDMKKRLLISLWHKQDSHSHSELLGCMSFGVRHIVQKKSEVDGWYFLLSDAVGKRKHLQVGSQHHQKLSQSTTQTSEEESERTDSNRMVVLSDSSHENTEIFMVTLPKGPGGFGLQVGGDRPAFVLRIQEDSTSARAGLMPGDCIVKVDDHDVSNLSSDTVARILKQCQGNVTLGIHRNQKPPDILQEVRSPPNTQENSLLMSSKEFLPSALPNKFKFDAMVNKPASSQFREVKTLPAGPSVKERRVQIPTGSPIGGRRLVKPSNSPIPERRPIKPSGSPVVERRPLKPSGSPIIERRMAEIIHVVTNSPISNRRHSKRLLDHANDGDMVDYGAIDGQALTNQVQGAAAPLRDHRYSTGSPPTRRRDVVNVSEEIRNGQQRGKVFTSPHGNTCNDLGHQDMRTSHAEHTRNSSDNYKGQNGHYQTSNLPQGSHQMSNGSQLPVTNKQYSGNPYQNGYSENQRTMPNAYQDSGRNVMGDNTRQQYKNGTIPYTENHIPSHLVQNQNSELPKTNYSDNSYVQRQSRDAALYNGQTQHVVKNGSADRQKRRIPTCDDSSSEDENFFVHSKTQTGVNQEMNYSNTVQHQAVSSAYKTTSYKVSSF